MRFAGIIAKTAQGFISDIRISRGTGMADCKSPLELISLGASCGSSLLLTAEGPDADEAVRKMADIFNNFQVQV